jgi:hypothetical protein
VSQKRAADLSKTLTPEVTFRPDRGPHTVTVVNAPDFQIEISQTIVVSKIDSLVQAWCASCGAEGQWVIPEHAAVILNSDTRTIYRRIEAGVVHFFESTDGLALVCLNSLLK